MSKFIIFGRQYSKQFLAIAVFIGVDFFTSLGDYLRGVLDGSIKFNGLSFGIFICTAVVSTLNVIKAAQSQAWHKASSNDTSTPASK